MTSVYDFSATAIDGAETALEQYRGQALLIVNTASKCGFTGQYAGLEALHRQYTDKPFQVLGFPCNQFGSQEPGKAAEIKAFCETFDVSFPLADRQVVTGGGAHPFYRWVVAELGEAGAPRWNFHKYLVAPDGTLAGAWPSQVKPDAADILREIESLLAKS